MLNNKYITNTIKMCHNWFNPFRATDNQNFDTPPVSTFLSNYFRYCFLKHTNWKIFSWWSLSWKLRSKSMPYGKVMTLWMRVGVCGAFHTKIWSFLVPVEVMKPVSFESIAKLFEDTSLHTVEVATRDDRHNWNSSHIDLHRRRHGQSIETWMRHLTSNDRHGVISC